MLVIHMNVKYLSILIFIIFVLSFNSVNAADIDDFSDDVGLQSDFYLESSVDDEGSSTSLSSENTDDYDSSDLYLESSVDDEELSTSLSDENIGDSQSQNQITLTVSGESPVLANNNNASVMVNSNVNANDLGLSITVVSKNLTAYVGDSISFDVIIKNRGNKNLTGVYVDTVHEGLIFELYSGSNPWYRVNDRYMYDGTFNVNQTETLSMFFIVNKTGVLQLNAIVGANNKTYDRAYNETKILNVSNEDKDSINNKSYDSVANKEKVNAKSAAKAINFSKYATGNPILLSLLSLMFLPIRRFV